MDDETRRKLYAEDIGRRALERQQELANERHSCCWERVEGGHNPACRNYVEPVMDGQVSLV